MNAAIIGYAVYGLIALLLAAILVLTFGFVLHAGTRVRNDPLPLIFFAILVAIMASPIATGRILTAGLFESNASAEEIGSAFWLSRVATLVVLALCGERILRFFVRRDSKSTVGWALFWSFAAYAFSNQILNSAFGANPSFDHKALYSFVFYLAAFLAAQHEPERCLRLARNALLFFLVASAAVAILQPAMVIERGYSGGLPGLSIRYYGLATHANTMGPLIIAFAICLWGFPFKLTSINIGAWILSAGSLLLTQSKTSILIAIVIAMFLTGYQYRSRLITRVPGGRFGLSVGTMAVLCFLLAAIVLAFYFGGSLLEPQLRKWDSASGGQISSLTGRTRIWGIAWHEFMSHPIFGYGPSIWGPDYRLSIGAQFASHAHNQLLQSLSSAGIIGGIGLVTYIFVIITYGFRAMQRSRGVSLALVALLLLRTFSEVPLAVAQVMQSEFFIHLLALVACVGFAHSKSPGGARKATRSSLGRPLQSELAVSRHSTS